MDKKIFYNISSFKNNTKLIKCKNNLPVFEFQNAKTFQELLADINTKNIYLPLDFDTEFQTINLYNERQFKENGINTLTITSQLKPVNYHYEDTLIFNNSLFVRLYPHLKKYPVYTNNLFETFLRQFELYGKFYENRNSYKSKQGIEKYKRISSKKKLTIVLYFHFGQVDFYKAFNGEFLENVLEDSAGKYTQIIKDKRFHTKNDFNYKPKWFFQHLETGEVLPIEFKLIDQIAIYGEVSRSLKGVFKSVNINTTVKNSLTSTQKQNIIKTYEFNHESFLEYAKNDCRIHECLLKIIENNFKLYDDLNLKSDVLPTLTLGSTTKNTFIERLKQKTNDKKVVENIRDNSTKQLSKNLSKTLALNSIVNGGRAFNCNPLVMSKKQFFLDWDFKSAYVINMLIQPYFIGKTEYYDSSKQRKTTLRNFLNKHQKHFIDRSFQIIINGKLTQNQNYFISNELPNKYYQLIDYSHIKDEDKLLELMGVAIPNKNYSECDKKQLKQNKINYESRGVWINDKSASRKILANELNNTIVTYDDLKWIFDHATPTLRNEILDCDVVTAMWYDKDKEIFDYSNINKNENWYRLTVGELLINEVFTLRRKYDDKSIPYNKVMNGIVKYLGNSLAGDLMSSFFDISNPIVSNSICARTRHCGWLGQSINTMILITDGGVLNLLKMLYPNYPNKINSDIVCYEKYKEDTQHYQLKPIGEVKQLKFVENGVNVTLNDETTLNLIDKEFKKARNYFDNLLHKELKNIFPYSHIFNEKIILPDTKEIIDGFIFSSKGIVENIVFHGQANYHFKGGYHENFNRENVELKMRSYCMKYRLVKDVLNDFMDNLSTPKNVLRSKPFLITQIITPKIYSVRKKVFKNKNLIIGDTLYKPCWFRECSLSSFHFKTIAQYNHYVKKQQSLKNKYGQSFEMFFTNEDGTLNYEEMMFYLYEEIKNNNEFKKPKNTNYIEHPHFKEYKILKNWCELEYASKNQTVFLNDLMKQFDFEIIDNTGYEDMIKVNDDLKDDFDLDDLLDDLLSA